MLIVGENSENSKTCNEKSRVEEDSAFVGGKIFTIFVVIDYFFPNFFLNPASPIKPETRMSIVVGSGIDTFNTDREAVSVLDLHIRKSDRRKGSDQLKHTAGFTNLPSLYYPIIVPLLLN
jgi:hypothetical protein